MGKSGRYILYIGAMIMPDRNAGAQRARSILKSIQEIGYQGVVVGLDNQLPSGSDVLSTKAVYHGTDCYCVRYPATVGEWLNRMWTIQPFVQVMEAYGIENFKAVLAIDYEVAALCRLRHFCRKHDIALIADSMEWYEKSDLPFPRNLVKDLDTSLRMKWLYPKFKNMICISQYLYNHFHGLVANVAKVPVSIDRTEEKWSKLPDYRPQPICTIAYAGNPGDHCIKERVDWLIRAACELSAQGTACRLRLMGFDQEWFEGQNPSLMQLAGYRETVCYLGKLTHRECLSEQAQADFFAIIREDRLVTRAGFPTKLSEGIGCGTPVLATPFSNIAEYLQPGGEACRVGFLSSGFEYQDVVWLVQQAVRCSEEQRMNLHQQCKEFHELDYNRFNDELEVFLNGLYE